MGIPISSKLATFFKEAAKSPAAKPAAPQAQPKPLEDQSTFVAARTQRVKVQIDPQLLATPAEPVAETRTPTGTLERDGGAVSALDWAWSKLENRGYDNWCLDFVKNAYGIHLDAGQRCPEIYQANFQNSAQGAFLALQANGKILPASGQPDPSAPLPEGAIVFFGPTEENLQCGHICIATGLMADDGTPQVITSGFPGRPGVHYSSVGQLSEQSGPFTGYTTPEVAFAPGTYPASEDVITETPAGDAFAEDAVSTESPVSDPGQAAAAAPASLNPAGNMQQGWSNSCGANALMSLEAAVDPERAAQMAAMSPEERSAFEAAVMASDPSQPFQVHTRPGGSTVGWGTFMMERHVTERFGGTAQVVHPQNRAGAVDSLISMLEQGKPVAIGLPTHWVSATAIRDTPEGRQILVHESWTGSSAWVPEADLRQPGSAWMRQHFPGAGFDASIVSLVAPGEPTLNPDSTFRQTEG